MRRLREGGSNQENGGRIPLKHLPMILVGLDLAFAHH